MEVAMRAMVVFQAAAQAQLRALCCFSRMVAFIGVALLAEVFPAKCHCCKQVANTTFLAHPVMGRSYILASYHSAWLGVMPAIKQFSYDTFSCC
jgi:hypothetical protein